MNGQDEYAPERGVGGFPEIGPSANTCAIFWVLRSSAWRVSRGPSRRGLGSPFPSRAAQYPARALWVVHWSSCSCAISMDQPEVRRVGFPSFALSPPSRARAPLLLWGRRSSGSGGGLCAMLGAPKFVPMARPYAFDIPIYLFIFQTGLRKLRATRAR